MGMDIFAKFCNLCCKTNSVLRDVTNNEKGMSQMRSIIKTCVTEMDFQKFNPVFLCECCCNVFVNLSRFREISTKNFLELRMRLLHIQLKLEYEEKATEEIEQILKSHINEAKINTARYFDKVPIADTMNWLIVKENLNIEQEAKKAEDTQTGHNPDAMSSAEDSNDDSFYRAFAVSPVHSSAIISRTPSPETVTRIVENLIRQANDPGDNVSEYSEKNDNNNDIKIKKEIESDYDFDEETRHSDISAVVSVAGEENVNLNENDTESGEKLKDKINSSKQISMLKTVEPAKLNVINEGRSNSILSQNTENCNIKTEIKEEPARDYPEMSECSVILINIGARNTNSNEKNIQDKENITEDSGNTEDCQVIEDKQQTEDISLTAQLRRSRRLRKRTKKYRDDTYIDQRSEKSCNRWTAKHRHHRNNSSSDDPAPMTYKCKHCTDRAYTKREVYARHLKRTHGIVLSVANYPVTSKKTESPNNTATTSIKQYKNVCQVCNKGFREQHSLTVHSRVHTGERPYQCNICQKKFTQLSVLYRHKRIHTDERPYFCSVCKKAFRSNYYFIKHKRIHTGEKPYVCPVCGKAFAFSCSLKRHTVVHTGEKVYACSVCEKAFADYAHLINHKRIHSGEKPFKCLVCAKSFREYSHLFVHKQIHMSEKRHKCPKCPASFARRYLLIGHRTKCKH